MTTEISVREASFVSNGVRIHYAAAGAGDPVLLVHGFLGDRTMWDAGAQGGSTLLRRLAVDRTVVAVDARGHGRSDKPHDPTAYGLEMVADLARLLDHLGFARADLVGYSMGGFLVSNLLLREPDRVRSAVLIGGVGSTRREFEEDEDFARRPFAAAAETLRAGRGVIPLVRWLASAGGPMSELQGEALTAFNDSLLAGQDPIALSACIAAFPALFDLPAGRRAANRVPVLAMAGDLDVWLRFMTRYTRDFGGVTLRPLSGVDHGIFGSREADDLTEAFLRRGRQSPGS